MEVFLYHMSNYLMKVSVSAMSFLRGSSNYVWCTTSVLGKGATGAVFQGVDRHTGEPVAVKTFNQLSHMRPQEVQMREFEVLQKVNHENIVKLLAIEEEQDGRGKVIVMELCTGGSLFSILDDPENSHGLEESEFLLVLKHLAAGMKHLRDNNLVHRDLKPGNIMKYIDVDGSTVYKLTDFGAARELQDDQQFMSLYGTEEYLHPDMYERAVLRKTVGKSFGASVDLWSIGLCKLVTPLLGGLLEVDPQRMWNFDEFFSEVTKLLSKRVVHVFFVNRVQPLIIYMDPEQNSFSLQHLQNLQHLVYEQTDVDPTHQLLLFDNKFYSGLVDESKPGKTIPTTTPTFPVVLFSKQEDDVTLLLPKVPALKFPVFPNMVSVDHDAAVGKSICSIGYAVKRRIEYFCKCIRLIEHSVFIFVEVIVHQLKMLHSELDHLEKLTSAMSERFSQFIANHRRFLMVIQILSNGAESSLHVLREKLEDLVNNKVEDEKSNLLPTFHRSLKQMYNRVVQTGQLRRQWNPPQSSTASAIERCPNKAATYVLKLRESWQHLLRDRAAATLTFNDEQFHLLEKMKMKETTKCLETLLSSVTNSLHQATEHLADWCKVAKVQRVQTEIEETDVERHKELLSTFQRKLTETEESYHQTLSDILSFVKDRNLQDSHQLKGFSQELTDNKLSHSSYTSSYKEEIEAVK
ncbi:Serine/threonine-protein kinase TBK1 [Armadillidium nasatum]|uniref:Serine/threonine-protein kinase TBK1 n=1 Tax=Armadillidium nasatum TaxID=96803 RepID=A0A5N5T2Z7_9CRUS|nr:Serine/threonine-protein kinase TBK1 [Armadillidium nasatum]